MPFIAAIEGRLAADSISVKKIENSNLSFMIFPRLKRKNAMSSSPCPLKSGRTFSYRPFLHLNGRAR
jgi:hypothetical protein